MNDLAALGYHFRELVSFVGAVRRRMQRGSLLWRALATGLTGGLPASCCTSQKCDLPFTTITVGKPPPHNPVMHAAS